MKRFVMRHPDLPGQPILVGAENEQALSSGNSPQERAGWRLAETTDEQSTNQPPAEPVDQSKE